MSSSWSPVSAAAAPGSIGQSTSSKWNASLCRLSEVSSVNSETASVNGSVRIFCSRSFASC